MIVETIQADWMLTDEEWEEHRKLVLTHPTQYEQGNIAVYRLGNTNKVMILLTGDVIDTQYAITKVWEKTGLEANLHVYMPGDTNMLNAIYTVLDRWKVKSKVRCQGFDRVFEWQKWMKELICELD